MNCETLKEKINDFIEGNLDNQEREAVRKHLEECSACDSLYQQYILLDKKIRAHKDEMPPSSLKKNFLDILDAEKELLNRKVPNKGLNKTSLFQSSYKSWFAVAAALLFLISGAALGFLFGSLNQNQQISQLNSKVDEMQEMLLISKLQQPMASQRIMAVSYVDDIEEPDSNLINALLTTMANDENTNVRMAAIQALMNYGDMPEVKDAFIRSLKNEQDPMIQIALISFLVNTSNKQAIPSLRELMENNETDQNVRNIARKGMQMLI